eukprot:1952948-Heterocapsa_arctica.AAC.1
MPMLAVCIEPLAAKGLKLTFPSSLVQIAMASGLKLVVSEDQGIGDWVTDMTMRVPSGINQPQS